MTTTTVTTLIGTFLTDLTDILYGVIPQVLVAVAIFMGISLGVRYVRKWVFGSAR